MSNRVGISALCLVIALALAFGSLPRHGALSLSQQPAAFAPAEAERHVQTGAESTDHGYGHDEGSEHGQAAAHSHGHDPADHSHAIPNIPLVEVALSSIPARAWVPMPPVSAHIDPSNRLDRPPTPIARPI